MSTSPWFVVSVAELAAERLAQEGWPALSVIRDPRGPFAYADVHAFVINTRGDVLADLLQPELEGRNELERRSVDGRAVQRELIALVEQGGAGWQTRYLWPRPGGEPGLRRRDLYVRRLVIEGETLGVGAGLYVD